MCSTTCEIRCERATDFICFTYKRKSCWLEVLWCSRKGVKNDGKLSWIQTHVKVCVLNKNLNINLSCLQVKKRSIKLNRVKEFSVKFFYTSPANVNCNIRFCGILHRDYHFAAKIFFSDYHLSFFSWYETFLTKNIMNGWCKMLLMLKQISYKKTSLSLEILSESFRTKARF